MIQIFCNTRNLIRFWGDWSDWSPVHNDTCAGNMIVGRQKSRDCFCERLSLGVTRNNCNGSNFEYQKKTVEIVPLVGGKTQPEDSFQVCDEKNLTLFTAFYLLCDKSETISSDSIFWTNFRRVSDLEQIYYDNQSDLYLPDNSSVWEQGQPDFHGRKDFCVEVQWAKIHDSWCSGAKFDVNKIVCDIFE